MDLRRMTFFFAAVYFVQGIAEPKAGLATQPLFFLLKDEMRLSAAETATFIALTGIAWNVKPLYGLVSDLLPLFGYRRRSYLLLTTLLAALGWLSLGLSGSYPYTLTLVVLSVTGIGLAFTDVLCDAVMVEQGRPRGLTGRFLSIQWGAIYAASVIAGVGGGYLSEHVSYANVFLLVSVFPLISFAASAYCVREKRTHFDRTTLRETTRAVREGLRSGPLWRALVFLLLWSFSPSFGVPLEYYMVDVLGISKIELGWLATIASIGAIAGAVLYGRFARGVPIKPLLNLAIAVGVVGTLAYLGLVGWWSAVALSLVVSVATMVATLATLDLAARAVPAHAEGTFFAALASIANIGMTGSAWLGGYLYDRWGLSWLILISAATTAACWPLVPWLKVEPPPEPPAPKL